MSETQVDKRDDFLGELRRFLSEITAFANVIASGIGVPMPSVSGSVKGPYEDALETDDEYVVTIELAGAEAKDIHVNASKRAIEVEVAGPGNSIIFDRDYQTDCDIKEKELKITYKNGVLEVRARKK